MMEMSNSSISAPEESFDPSIAIPSVLSSNFVTLCPHLSLAEERPGEDLVLPEEERLDFFDDDLFDLFG